VKALACTGDRWEGRIRWREYILPQVADSSIGGQGNYRTTVLYILDSSFIWRERRIQKLVNE